MLHDPRPIKTLQQALQEVLEHLGIEFLPSQWRVQEGLLPKTDFSELKLLKAYLDACGLEYQLHEQVLPEERTHLDPHCLVMTEKGQSGHLSDVATTHLTLAWALCIKPLNTRHSLADSSSSPTSLLAFWQQLRRSDWLREAFQFEKGSFQPVVVASLLINMLALAGPLFSLQVYDRIIPNQAYASLFALLAGVALCLGFEHVLKHARHRLMEIAATTIDTRCTQRLSRQLLNVRSHHTEPALLLQHLRSFEQLRELITGVVLLAAIDLPFLLLFIAVIGLIHPLFLLISTALILTTLALIAYSHRELATLGTAHSRHARNSQAQWLDSLACLENIQAHGVKEAHRSLLNQLQLKARLEGNQLRDALFLINQRIHLLQQAGWLCTLALGVYLVVEKQLTMGGLIAVSMLTMRCFAPIQKLQAHLVNTHAAQVSFEELDQFLRNSQPVSSQQAALNTIRHLAVNDAHVLKPGLSGTDVGFSPFMLQQLNLSIPAGSRLGIIGPSGSGKTSLLRLLAGQLPCSTGNVTINHLSMVHYHPEEFHSKVGYAAQPPVLIKGSLLDNIRFMRPEVSTESCWRILQQLGLKHWVQAHPDGIHMAIDSQGANLSSGQRQAVSLCRALVGQPALLLLDEPTMCLDQAGETCLIQCLQQLEEHTTLVFTTHKLGLLACANSLVLMNNGQIHSQGDKAQVLHEARQLAKSQDMYKGEQA